VRKHGFCQSGGLVGRLAAKPLAALYASDTTALPTPNMALYCAEINDVAVQYEDRENYRAFHTHAAIRTAIHSLL
jgi:hypothetical protein